MTATADQQQIRIGPLSEDDQVKFAKALTDRPDLWDDLSAEEPAALLAGLLYHPQHVFVKVEPDVGVIYFTNVLPGYSAQIHFVSFRNNVYGVARTAFRQAVAHMSDKLGIHRIYAVVPSNNRAGNVYCRYVGMKHEGTLRHTTKYYGKWVDSLVFSWLSGEEDDR